MSYLIMSPAKEFFTGVWIDGVEGTSKPEWAALEKAMRYGTKEEALEYVRAAVSDARTAEIPPEFVGARVVSLGFLAVLELRRQGYKAREVEGGLLLDFDPRGVLLRKAIAALPKESLGIPVVRILAKGKPVA